MTASECSLSFPPNRTTSDLTSDYFVLERKDATYFLSAPHQVTTKVVPRSQLPLLRRVLNDTHDEALLHVRYLQKGPERCGDAALYLRYTCHWVTYQVSWWSLRAALPPLALPPPPPRRRMPRQHRRAAPTPMR